MKKFNFLVGFGLKKRIARKSFVISNIIVLIVMVLLINLPTIISKFATDQEDEQLNLVIYNNVGEADLIEKLHQYLNPGEKEYFVLTEKEEPFNEEVFWENNDNEIAITFEGTINNPVIEIYTDDSIAFSTLQNAIEILIINYQITDYEPPQIMMVLPPNYENPEEEMLLSSIMSLLVLPLFFLVIMATQFVGVDIIEEKSTKAIETIISSVPANTHFLSKITASISFVLIQGALMIIFGAIGFGVNRLIGDIGVSGPTDAGSIGIIEMILQMMPNWPVVLVITFLFIAFGTLLYLVIAAVFAAMAVTQEDYQQFQAPLMIILLAAFYIAIFGPMTGATGFVKAMSFVPVFSPILAPVAFASGIITLGETLISLLITIITLLLLIKLFTPVYKVAILSYDQTKFFTRVKNYFKKGLQKPNKNKQ